MGPYFCLLVCISESDMTYKEKERKTSHFGFFFASQMNYVFMFTICVYFFYQILYSFTLLSSCDRYSSYLRLERDSWLENVMDANFLIKVLFPIANCMKIPRKAEKYFPNASTIEVFTNMTTRHYRDIQVVFLCNDHDLQFCLRKKYVSLSQGEKINLSFSSSANDVHIYSCSLSVRQKHLYTWSYSSTILSPAPYSNK